MLDPRPVRAAPLHTAEERRLLEALLRWRIRWMARALTPRRYLAARLFPVLLHASFNRSPLGEDALGVSGLRYRPSWSRWTRALDLPPPARAQRGPSLVDAVVAAAGAAGGVDILVLVPPGLSGEDLALVQDRAELAQQALDAAAAPARVEVLDPGRLDREPLAVLRILLFGALVGGRIPAPSWQALEEAGRAAVPPGRLAELGAVAPTSMSRLALALMGEGAAFGPLVPLARLMRQGEPARLLSEPSVLLAVWAGQVTDLQEPLCQALRLTSPRAALRPRMHSELDIGELMRLGRSLAVACARAAHRAHLRGSAGRVWREALGPGIPRILLPVLGQRLAELSQGTGLPLTPEQVGGAFEVRLPDGTALAHGATPAQARVRAIALAAEAGGEQLVRALDPAWAPVAARLVRPRPCPTRLLLLEPAGGAGPPFDPLNRGPRRELAFAGALAIHVAPGRMPSARVLSAEETVVLALRTTQAGMALEVVPGRVEARPVATRLAQIAGLLREPPGPGLALQVGGAVYVPRSGALRRYGLDRFLARPRRITSDPDAPDLALLPGDRKRPQWASPGMVQCRVAMLDGTSVAVLYADGTGQQLRERVELSALEEHLRDTRSILQAADPGAALALHFSDDVEPALRRATPAGPRFEVAVSGELPLGLVLGFGGESFEARQPHGWSSAAQAILARWPLRAEGHVVVKSVAVRAGGEEAKGLPALYARSLTLRRLRAHLRRLVAPYRAREASRQNR